MKTFSQLLARVIADFISLYESGSRDIHLLIDIKDGDFCYKLSCDDTLPYKKGE